MLKADYREALVYGKDMAVLYLGEVWVMAKGLAKSRVCVGGIEAGTLQGVSAVGKEGSQPGIHTLV